MVWWNGIVEYRQRAAIIAGVAFAHLIGLAAILSHVVEISDPPARNVLELELAELAPPPEPIPEPPAPPPEPIAEPQREPLQPVAPPAPAPAPTAPDDIPEQLRESATQPEPPSVLTQLEQGETGLVDTNQNDLASDSSEGEAVTSAQIASVLRQSECLKLKQNYEAPCPQTDPFVAAAGVAERAIPPERLFADPRYVAKTIDDIVFEQKWAKLFHTPDADLFADPEPPGAYNARRIRNGQEPLWSEEMKAGFRKKD